MDCDDEPSLFQLEKAKIVQTERGSYRIYYPSHEIEDDEGNVVKRLDSGYVLGEWRSEVEARQILREIKKRRLKSIYH